MLTCTCDAPDIEYTVVKDECDKIILLQAYCSNCGKSASGFGLTVEQALKEVGKEWRKKKKK